MADRSSKPLGPNLGPIVPEKDRARHEVINGFRQFDELSEMLQAGLRAERFELKPWMLIKLNRLSVEGLQEDAGRYRLSEIEITDSKLRPPPHVDVAQFVDELCDYVNSNWTRSAVHLASYVMWRLNWIHPFSDGNGRTSRAASFLVLCVRFGGELPGDKTIPLQIVENKEPYYKALESADVVTPTGEPDLGPMEHLLGTLLQRQIMNAATATWSRSTKIQRTTGPRGESTGSPIAISADSNLPAIRKKGWIAEHPIASSVIGAIGAIIAAIITTMCK